jgi:hypothetical protein
MTKPSPLQPLRAAAPSTTLWAALLTLLVAGCATPPPAPPAPTGGLAELMERPAERLLFEGIGAAGRPAQRARPGQRTQAAGLHHLHQ